VAFAAVLGIAVSLAAFVGVSDWEHRLRDLKIEDLARNRNQTIAGELAYTGELLQIIGAYIEALDHPVSGEEFLAFTSRLRIRHPELRSTGWSPRIPQGDRDAFELAMREQGYPNFEIWENDRSGKRRRASDREEYFPILYRDPTDLTAKVIGFDVASTPDRIEVMQRALASGRPFATSAITLISEDRPLIGLMNFAAVAGPRGGHETTGGLPAGFAFAVFYLQQVFEKILATTLPAGFDIYFYDPQAAPEKRFIYWHSSRTRATPQPFTSEASLLAGPHWSGTFKVAGRELGAIYVPTEKLLDRDASWEATATLFAGLAITVIIVIYLLTSLRRTARLEVLARRLQQTTDELRCNNEKVEHLAHHDSLTGLANRAQLRKEIGQCGRQLDQNGIPFGVLILDLDRFKEVNDSLGHAAGDALLKAVARRLTSAIRRNDVLARLGGDEFAVIQTAPRDITECSAGPADHRRGATDLANRILEMLAAPFDLDGNTVFIGCSIGISLAPDDGTDPEDLIKKADLALYEAKSAGRNRYFLFNSEMTKVADQRHRLEADMRTGLVRGEFELHYQPVVDVWTRKIACMEALVRWRHPVHGLMLPDQFIPLAEETGLIVRLGAWVLHQACGDAKSWPGDVKVAVNLSAVQLSKANFLDAVLVSLIDADLLPQRLEVEVTETVLLSKETDCISMLHQLRNIGVSVALDDFGTGYSSLSYLKRFPFDKIKIDKSFTHDITERADCAAIVSSIIGLGRSLDIVTTVEGVETERQFEMIRSGGATLAQGYLFGRPVPVAELDFGEAEGAQQAGAAA